MTPLQRVVERLGSVRQDEGQFSAICPAHEDQKPSLSIKEGEDGRILVHCHAGCEPDSILRAIGLSLADLFPEKSPTYRSPGKIVATYDYRDAVGRIRYQVVRYSPKGFRQRRPDGAGGWLWNLDGVERIPYRLPEVLAADPEKPIYVVEGEKDADRLAALGVVSTTNSGGAGKWHDDHSKPLSGRDVVVIPDNDEPGRRHASLVVQSVTKTARSVRLLALTPTSKDISDWLDAGHTVDDLLALAGSTPEGTPTTGAPLIVREPVSSSREPSHAQSVIGIARMMELFHDSKGDGYATFAVGDHVETWLIRSRGFRRFISRQFYLTHGRPPSTQALQDALSVIEGIATYEGQQHTVYTRLAEHNGAVYLDLGDDGWHVIEVDAKGWRVVDSVPVRFRRARGMGALPIPRTGGDIHTLRRLLNVSDESWPLLLAWLVAALRPTGPYPVLMLHGEQGSGKSTTARVLRSLVDPNTAALRAEPREPRDLMITATNSWVVALDNLSDLPPWLSDALCRLSTGGAFGTRQLYSDDEEVLFDSTRPIILNGISEVATRGDLLDRCIVLCLPPIAEQDRRAEAAFKKEFADMHPYVLGCLLDAVSTGLRNLPNTNLACMVRMADFCLWAAATAPALGYDAPSVVDAYRRNRRDVNVLALEGSLIAGLLQELPEFNGECQELLARLSDMATESVKKQRDWPKTPRGLSGHLRRLAPNLRALGVNIEFSIETIGQRRRLVSIRTTNPVDEPDRNETKGDTVRDIRAGSTVSFQVVASTEHETDETVETVQPLLLPIPTGFIAGEE